MKGGLLVKDDYVLVPPEEAKFLNDLREISKRGQSADGVKYIARRKEWVYFVNDKHKRTVKVG